MKYICKKHGDQTGYALLFKFAGDTRKLCRYCFYEALDKSGLVLEEVDDDKDN